MISVTLTFPDALAASHALARMAAPEQFATATVEHQQVGDIGQTVTTISYNDRPDVGAAPAPAAPLPVMPDPAAAAFGGAVAQAAPLVAPLPAAALQMPGLASIAPSVATGQTAAPGTVERDSTGLVWDGRIHASTKTKTKEGVWTAKRNVDPAFKAQVEADLRGVAAPAATGPAAGPAAPPVAALAALAAPQTQPPATPPAAPAGAAEVLTFPSYMAQIGAAFANRPLDAHNHMATALATVGMQHVGQLAGRPDLIPAVDAEFRRLLG